MFLEFISMCFNFVLILSYSMHSSGDHIASDSYLWYVSLVASKRIYDCSISATVEITVEINFCIRGSVVW